MSYMVFYILLLKHQCHMLTYTFIHVQRNMKLRKIFFMSPRIQHMHNPSWTLLMINVIDLALPLTSFHTRFILLGIWKRIHTWINVVMMIKHEFISTKKDCTGDSNPVLVPLILHMHDALTYVWHIARQTHYIDSNQIPNFWSWFKWQLLLAWL